MSAVGHGLLLPAAMLAQRETPGTPAHRLCGHAVGWTWLNPRWLRDSRLRLEPPRRRPYSEAALGPAS